jgi:branched-chain amino acid transport system permease protein
VTQQLALGLANGSVYGLLALGLVLILRTTGVANFGHTDMGLVCAFGAWVLVTHHVTPVGISAVFAMVAGSLIGALCFHAVFHPMREAPLLVVFIATFIVGGAINVVVQLAWGSELRTFPPLIAGSPGFLHGASWHAVALIAIGLASALGMHAVLNWTRIGLGVRAVHDDELAATLSGIPGWLMGTVVWAIGIALAGLAATLAAPSSFLGVATLSPLLLKAFCGAVIGGLSTMWGAYAGCLVLGVLEVLVGRTLPSNLLSLRDSLALALLAVVLWVRPQGVFARTRETRIA